MALFFGGGINKGPRYKSKGLTVKNWILAVIRAGVGGAGVKFGPA